ncbi:MAG TPA: hypothetical protein VFG52_02575, partial [Xanthomonadales bacterium]|nr:hypothetical protein [Xanthomonadales bacterium]
MKFTQDIEVHYPTTVLQRQFEGVEEINSRLFTLLKSMQTRFQDTAQNAVNSGLISTQGGYQTSSNLNLFQLKEEVITRFRDEIVLPTVRTYLDQVFGDQAVHFNPWPDGWANMLKAGDWQRPHFHPTHRNLVCGVYYVQIPPD